MKGIGRFIVMAVVILSCSRASALEHVIQLDFTMPDVVAERHTWGDPSVGAARVPSADDPPASDVRLVDLNGQPITALTLEAQHGSASIRIPVRVLADVPFTEVRVRKVAPPELRDERGDRMPLDLMLNGEFFPHEWLYLERSNIPKEDADPQVKNDADQQDATQFNLVVRSKEPLQAYRPGARYTGELKLDLTTVR